MIHEPPRPSLPLVWGTVRAALVQPTRRLPVEALALADAHRDAIAPHLVGKIEALAVDPDCIDEDPDGLLLHFAIYLLGWWRDPRGLDPLVALMRNPCVILRETEYGDDLGAMLGRCLASMARHRIQPLKDLAEDVEVHTSARESALEALKACVIEGDASRDEVLDFLRTMAPDWADEARGDQDEPPLLNAAVDLIADLGGADMLPAIRKWNEEGLLDPHLTSMRKVERSAILPYQELRLVLLNEVCGYVQDPQTELGWWSCFRDTRPPPEPPDRPKAPLHTPVVVHPPPPTPLVRESPKVGRNDPCPCGSGMKFKKCHGAG